VVLDDQNPGPAIAIAASLAVAQVRQRLAFALLLLKPGRRILQQRRIVWGESSTRKIDHGPIIVPVVVTAR
jgi:hypothetical protein